MNTKVQERDQRIMIYGRDWANIFLGASAWPMWHAFYEWITIGLQIWNNVWMSALLNSISIILFVCSTQAKHRLIKIAE